MCSEFVSTTVHSHLFVYVCCNVVPLQSMFTQGSVMILQSVASGSTLCINDGEVSGKGIRNSHCKRAVVLLQTITTSSCAVGCLIHVP